VSGLYWVLLGLVALTSLLHVLAWLVRLPLASRLLGDLPWLPAHSGGPITGGQDVEFRAADGVRLRGTYLHTTATRRRGVVLFCHELNGDRWSALAAGNALRRRGFDLFTFDFRNHGDSQRVTGYEPTPWVTPHELADVCAAIDYLTTRVDADPRGVGLVGFGRGASAAVCAAASQRRVRAVVADGLLPLERIQAIRLRRHLGPLHLLVPRLVTEWLAAAARTVACWQAHSTMLSVDRAVRRMRCPALLVCGGQDLHVPMEAIDQLRMRTAGPTSLWLVPEAGHARALIARPDLYARRLARFFVRHLATAVDAAHPRPRRTRKKIPALTPALIPAGQVAHASNGHVKPLPHHAK
jgi:pimeloyl-ACP methyl ester carboxylesterase